MVYKGCYSCKRSWESRRSIMDDERKDSLDPEKQLPFSFLKDVDRYNCWWNVQKQLPEVFCKKDVLRNFAKFTGKHLYQIKLLTPLVASSECMGAYRGFLCMNKKVLDECRGKHMFCCLLISPPWRRWRVESVACMDKLQEDSWYYSTWVHCRVSRYARDQQ